MPRAVRVLAWAAIAGQVAFVACWILAGALQRDYSHVEQAVSDLGGEVAQHAWVMNAGIVVVGLSVAALAPGLRRTLPARAAGAAAAALFALAGAAIAAHAFLPLQCSLSSEACRDRLEARALSWQTSAHVWAGSGVELLLLATPFAIAAALWRSPSGPAAPTPVGVAALLAGLAGIGLAGATALALRVAGDDAFGLIQRLSLLALHLWIGLVAAGILYASRSRADR